MAIAQNAGKVAIGGKVALVEYGRGSSRSGPAEILKERSWCRDLAQVVLQDPVQTS